MAVLDSKTLHDSAQEIPEKRLWRAVLNQAIEEGFGLYNSYMNDSERHYAKYFIDERTQNFNRLCENADIDSDIAWKRIQKLKLIQKGIVNANTKREIQALKLVEAIKQYNRTRSQSHRKSNRVEGRTSHRVTVK